MEKIRATHAVSWRYRLAPWVDALEEGFLLGKFRKTWVAKALGMRPNYFHRIYQKAKILAQQQEFKEMKHKMILEHGAVEEIKKMASPKKNLEVHQKTIILDGQGKRQGGASEESHGTNDPISTFSHFFKE